MTRRTNDERDPIDAHVVSPTRHLVDRALEYRALQRRGVTAVAIQRRKRKSKAYVSILTRFGALLERLDPIEVAVLRHPRVTFKLLQVIVRVGAEDRRIVRALREAVVLPRADGRSRRRLKLASMAPPADPDAFTFRWEADWATRDPLGYLEALEAYLRRVQRGVDHRMRALFASSAARGAGESSKVAASPAAVARAGGSLRAIAAALRAQANVQAGPVRDPLGRQVLERLAALDVVLRQLESRVERGIDSVEIDPVEIDPA